MRGRFRPWLVPFAVAVVLLVIALAIDGGARWAAVAVAAGLVVVGVVMFSSARDT